MERIGTLVVGGGVVGGAIADALALRGENVLLVERNTPGHSRGSSNGDGRIFRYSYPEADYVRLSALAEAGWRRLEERSGEQLLIQCGTWDAAPSGSTALDDLASAMASEGHASERFTAAESRARWPQLDLGDDHQALFQSGGGVLRARSSVNALWASAQRAGARLLEHHAVERIEPGEVGVRVEVRQLSSAVESPAKEQGAGQTWLAERVVLAGGAWNGALCHALGVDLPLRVTRELVAHFPERDRSASPTCSLASHGPDSLPAFLFYPLEGTGEPSVYGLPILDVAGVKVGRHHAGIQLDGPEQETDLDARNLELLRQFVEATMPHLEPRPIRTCPCLYTSTPDHDFVLDRLPADPRVVIAAGFSGHGFKFAPALGEIVAALALGEPSLFPLDRFRVDRPALRVTT